MNPKDLSPSPAREQPSISVIVPVYNGCDTIGACVEALLAQDYPAECREIIIVDNNSTDGTPDVVARYPVTLLHERAVQTSYAARNRGIGHARTDILAFTDADCITRRDWLSQIAAAFVAPDVVGVAGRIVPANSFGLIASFMAEINPVSSRQVNGLWYVVTGNAAYRRDALVAAGGFRTDLFTGGDIDLSLRLQLDWQGRIVPAPEAVVLHTYGNSCRELWKRFRRYGYSEILMGHLLKGRHDRRVNRPNQTLLVAKQLRALATYAASFLWRLRKVPQQGWLAEYNMRPVLWGVAESANVWGKVSGLRARYRASSRSERFR